MKTILLSTVILLSAMKLAGQDNSFKIPAVWDKTFVISVAHKGSMSAGSSHVTFTHDSCKYEITSRNEKPREKSFLLSAKDREVILAKMRKLKIEKIKPDMSFAPQRDGWSTLLCLGEDCIDGGSRSEMSEEDKNTFLDACRFLEDFAVKKKK